MSENRRTAQDYGYSDYGSLGQYTVSMADPNDDAYEQNDSLATAADPLGNGGEWERMWLSTIAGFGVSRDEDWYVVNVSQDFADLLVPPVASRNPEGISISFSTTPAVA